MVWDFRSEKNMDWTKGFSSSVCRATVALVQLICIYYWRVYRVRRFKPYSTAWKQSKTCQPRLRSYWFYSAEISSLFKCFNHKCCGTNLPRKNSKMSISWFFHRECWRRPAGTASFLSKVRDSSFQWEALRFPRWHQQYICTTGG